MANIDDELLADAEENAREIEFIKNQLSFELKEKFSDEDYYYMLDKILDYYYNSGVLDQEPDKEGFVDIDLDKVAEYVCQKAKEDNHGEFDPQDVFFVVQADMDFEEQSISE
jgi:hypothetical protein